MHFIKLFRLMVTPRFPFHHAKLPKYIEKRTIYRLLSADRIIFIISLYPTEYIVVRYRSDHMERLDFSLSRFKRLQLFSPYLKDETVVTWFQKAARVHGSPMM